VVDADKLYGGALFWLAGAISDGFLKTPEGRRSFDVLTLVICGFGWSPARIGIASLHASVMLTLLHPHTKKAKCTENVTPMLFREHSKPVSWNRLDGRSTGKQRAFRWRLVLCVMLQSY
jgi:hypothetical protein